MLSRRTVYSQRLRVLEPPSARLADKPRLVRSKQRPRLLVDTRHKSASGLLHPFPLGILINVPCATSILVGAHCLLIHADREETFYKQRLCKQRRNRTLVCFESSTLDKTVTRGKKKINTFKISKFVNEAQLLVVYDKTAIYCLLKVSIRDIYC